ncbi:MAG: Hsp20/alpha crystallin family protein [bacterium]|nr:Hsp20/alpha crystallin family protein [bacterium]
MAAWIKKLMGSEFMDDSQEDVALAPNEELEETSPRQRMTQDSDEDDENDGQLAVDVYQDKDNVYLKSTIAGVKPEDLDISIGSNIVTIRGERQQEEEIKGADYIVQECYWGSFSRSMALPVEIDPDKAEADLKDGILTLTLPKASRAKTKKLKIKSGI